MKTEEDNEVTIILKKWQIPYVLGAMRSGVWTEDWCSSLVSTSLNVYDVDAMRWISRVGFVIDEIKKQTGVTEEERDDGGSEWALGAIQKMVDNRCKFYIEKHKKE